MMNFKLFPLKGIIFENSKKTHFRTGLSLAGTLYDSVWKKFSSERQVLQYFELRYVKVKN